METQFKTEKIKEHQYLLDKKQNQCMMYFKLLDKPKCLMCNSQKNVIKHINYNSSESLKKISVFSKQIDFKFDHINRNKRWVCTKCQYYY